MALEQYKHPQNGFVEEFYPINAFLITLLLGPVYFLIRGIWTHAAASLVLAIVTAGFSWLLYPFFAPGIVRKHYLRQGYTAQAPIDSPKAEAKKSNTRLIIALAILAGMMLILANS